jgi:hypothetical protein
VLLPPAKLVAERIEKALKSAGITAPPPKPKLELDPEQWAGLLAAMDDFSDSRWPDWADVEMRANKVLAEHFDITATEKGDHA